NVPTLVHGNKISNISWNNIDNGNWIGIWAAQGEINIGSTSTNANTIGELSGSNAIVFTSTTIGPNMYPIQINSSDKVSCVSNNIGALSVMNARYLICINKNSDDGSTLISNNIIGSNYTANSIKISSNPLNATQFFTALHVQGTLNTVSGNMISNLVSLSKGTGYVRGIEIINGSNTITNNTISRIASASSYSTSLIGLTCSNSSFDNNISGNTISDLENTNIANNNGSIIGMNLDYTGTNNVEKNLIRNIYVPTSTTNTSIYGIKTLNGAATYSNNIVRLGTNTRSKIYGIYESGLQDCNLYHNTVYIDGNPTTGALNSYALFSASNTNTINYINNIFVNMRSNNGATGKHYCAFLNYASIGSITINYNEYYANGNGTVIGNFAGTAIPNIPIVSGQDANSIQSAPGFLSDGGSESIDYKTIITKFTGLGGIGVTEDFGGNARTAYPTMGAWEFSGENMWKGNVSTDWADPINWTLSTVPPSGSDLIFDPQPLNHLVLDANRLVNNITNQQSNYNIVLNGKKLSIQGELIFTHGAQLDATSVLSMLDFSGSDVQNIASSEFLNGEVYNLKANNPENVVLEGDLIVKGNITTGFGKFDAITNSCSITYSGSAGFQSITNIFLDSKIYNLIVDNALGLFLNTNITITNQLTINAGKLFIINSNRQLYVNGLILNNAGSSGLIINSTISGTGSLIHNTNSVQASVKRYIGGAATAWHFLSSPVQNQSINNAWKPSGSYGDGTGYDLYVWDEPAQCWVYNLNTSVAPTWNTVHPTADFIGGKGYLYALQATNQTKLFAGTLNNGNVNIAISNTGSGTNKGFNFIGNPYPSSIDWKEDLGFSRSMLEQNGAGYDIWVWSNSANNYGVYNSADLTDTGTNNISRYISPMMGFFVKATNAGSFVFKNAARVHNQAGNWMRSKSSIQNMNSIRFKLNSEDSIGTDEVMMHFNSELKVGGAAKMFSPVKTAPSLYIQNTEGNFTTTYLTENEPNDSTILCFKAGQSGAYSLTVQTPENCKLPVILEDKLKNKLHNFANGAYNFKSNTTDAAARFIIHLNEQPNIQNKLNYLPVYRVKNNILVDLTFIEGNFTVQVFDTNGKMIRQRVFEGGSLQTIEIGTSNMLVVKLMTQNKIRIIKLTD
ncbi:MAG: hypothetical protein AUK44_02455, partial [Porphyromonadaceae bacterium CG2_30_38_12]